MTQANINILTIDVEDYFQVDNLREAVNFSDWDKFESRVVGNTEKIIKILDSADTKATFFILGWVAERFPELIKKIHDLGHEIAGHGLNHQLVTTQNQKQFREDIRKAKEILENIIGEPICGYRAPTFSITKESEWALDILIEEGYKYDSSIFPFRYDKGGLPEDKRYIHKIFRHENYIWEFPISSIKMFNHNFPFSGGGYFRLIPYTLMKKLISRHNKTKHTVVVYLHPWEFDSKQPRIKAGWLNSFRHYLNISKTESKFKQLLKDFKFQPIRDFLGAEG